ncbi:MAG: ATP-binding protein [Chloroflexi bacterium]|nr:ATP-binding protein [Chloroflexota bacterium]
MKRKWVSDQMRNRHADSYFGHIPPFTAIVNQERMKKALLLNAINPMIGGVLISGQRGTAKSTAVRALAELLPEVEVVAGCPFNCNPHSSAMMCPSCREKFQGGEIRVERRRMWIVDLPLNATEDRVIGALDISEALKHGIKALQPGLLAAANQGILYIDEINLLDDHIVDILLDAAAMGVNVVEREGISLSHPTRFILVGTMNPKEGELRPQITDRIGLQVGVESVNDIARRTLILQREEAFTRDSGAFFAAWEKEQDRLRERVARAKQLLPQVEIPLAIHKAIATLGQRLKVEGHRAEISTLRCAITLAAFHGRKMVTQEDVAEAAELAFPHRLNVDQPLAAADPAPKELWHDLERIFEELSAEDADASEEGEDQPGDEAHTISPVPDVPQARRFALRADRLLKPKKKD